MTQDVSDGERAETYPEEIEALLNLAAHNGGAFDFLADAAAEDAASPTGQAVALGLMKLRRYRSGEGKRVVYTLTPKGRAAIGLDALMQGAEAESGGGLFRWFDRWRGRFG